MKIKNLLGRRALLWLMIFLFVSAIYLYAFPQANVFYAGVVLLHAFAGLIATVYLVIFLFRLIVFRQTAAKPREGFWMIRLGWILIAISATLGVALLKVGALRADYKLLYIHINLAFVGDGMLFAVLADRR